MEKDEISLNPGKEHNQYKPNPETIKKEIVDGVFKLSYSYFPLVEGEKPPYFEASVGLSKGKLFQHVVFGSPLSVKPSGTRGYNTAVSSNKQGTHRAHLIADWFRGSAYKEALNIINTSAEYNTGPMLAAEEKIEQGVDKIANKYPNKNITFDMTVDAKYIILTDEVTLNFFKSNLENGDAGELYKILQNNEDPRQTQSVNYLANGFRADGVDVSGEVKARADKDEWIN